MKNFIIAAFVSLISASFVLGYGTYALRTGKLATTIEAFADLIDGESRESRTTQASLESPRDLEGEFGSDAGQDAFLVVAENSTDIAYEKLPTVKYTFGNEIVASLNLDADMRYHNSYTEMPLKKADYYTGKYTNAAAGAGQINNTPVIKASDRVRLIADGFVHVKKSAGYIKPSGNYPNGSGLCWSTSVLGAMMNNANRDFKAKYGIDLFVFNRGDRAGHSSFYATYGGRGYTVLMNGYKNPVQDYSFTVNPAIASRSDLAGLKLKIVMVADSNHPSASRGQSIGAFLVSNYQF